MTSPQATAHGSGSVPWMITALLADDDAAARNPRQGVLSALRFRAP
ncbi:hypothetical protein ACFV2N_02835 [Streptomyces sp. NPDC059680]